LADCGLFDKEGQSQMAFDAARQKFGLLVEAYSGKSVDELTAITEGKEIALIFAIEIAIQQKEKREERDLSEEEVFVLAICALEREVNNGGYGQFFVNSSRLFTPVVVPALLRIGCPETAKITERAINAVGFRGLSPVAMCEAMDAYHAEYFRRNIHRILIPGATSETEKLSLVGSSKDPQFASSTEWESLEKEFHECNHLYYTSGERIKKQLMEFVMSNKSAIQP
jgi:hypothetical protein